MIRRFLPTAAVYERVGNFPGVSGAFGTHPADRHLANQHSGCEHSTKCDAHRDIMNIELLKESGNVSMRQSAPSPSDRGERRNCLLCRLPAPAACQMSIAYTVLLNHVTESVLDRTELVLI